MALMKLGLNSVNGLVQGGLKVGDSVVFAGTHHSYRTSMLIKEFVNYIMSNKPKAENATAVLFAEEETNEAIRRQMIVEMDAFEGKNVSYDRIHYGTEMQELSNRIKSTGYNVIITRLNVGESTITEFIDKLKKIHNDHPIEVIAFDVDSFRQEETTNRMTFSEQRRASRRKIIDFCKDAGATLFATGQINYSRKVEIEENTLSTPELAYMPERFPEGFQDYDLVLYLQLVQEDNGVSLKVTNKDGESTLVPFSVKQVLTDKKVEK